MSFKNKILCACYNEAEAGRSIPATDSQQLIYKQGNQIDVDYNFNFENNNKKSFYFLFFINMATAVKPACVHIG